MTKRRASVLARRAHDDGATRGIALVGALLALAIAGGTAALLAEVARTASVRSRTDRDAVAAWYLAEAGLAETVAAMAPGITFSRELSAGPGAFVYPAAGAYAAELRDDRDDTPDDPLADVNGRVLLRVTAAGPGQVRRRLDAVVVRDGEPFFPGAATLAGAVSNLTRDFRLDGRDATTDTGCTMLGHGGPRAGASLPDHALVPPLDDVAQISGVGTAPSIVRRTAPDLTPLRTAPGAVHAAPASLPSVLGSLAAPQLTVIDGDAAIDGTVSGAGVLYAAGHLRVNGRLDFTGVLAAAGGVEVTGSGELHVCGTLWAAGEPAFDARGRGEVRRSSEGIALAARVAPLPARARARAVRELF